MEKSFDISDWLRARGFGTVSAEMRDCIRVWKAWYKGFEENFHTYTVNNGLAITKQTKKSLKMAKFVAEDWANLLLNEKVKINVSKRGETPGRAQEGPSDLQTRIDDALKANSWTEEATRLIELTFALGTGALVEYMDEQGTPAIDYIRADMIFPLTWSGRKIVECAFGSRQTIGGKECVYVQLHLLRGGVYIIENRLFDADTSAELPLPENVQAIVPTGSTVPLFQIVRPAIVNNKDMDSPMGLSVFENSIDTLMEIDDIYDSFGSEYKLGRKRAIIPVSMAKMQMLTEKDAKGQPLTKPVFDPNDLLFYAMDMKNADKLEELGGDLRVTEHTDGLQAQLALLGKKVGVGCDRYIWDKAGGVKTATEVVSDKSDLYQNLKKHEHPLEIAITGMVEAMAQLLGIRDPLDVNVLFDDSIIQDAQSERQDAQAEVAAGLRSKLSYLMDVRGMTKQEAEEELARIAEESRVRVDNVEDFFSTEERPGAADSENATTEETTEVEDKQTEEERGGE